jgi:copper chaperone
MARYALTIDGMGCEGCVAAVAEAIEQLPGVRKVEVDLASGKASVEAEPALDESALRQALDKAGYDLTDVTA